MIHPTCAPKSAAGFVAQSLGAYVERDSQRYPLTASPSSKDYGHGGERETRAPIDFDIAAHGRLGEVRFVTQAVSRGSYEFQMCTDPSNEVNWQKIFTGHAGRIGEERPAASGTRYYFRAGAIDKNGMSRGHGERVWVAL